MEYYSSKGNNSTMLYRGVLSFLLLSSVVVIAIAKSNEESSITISRLLQAGSYGEGESSSSSGSGAGAAIAGVAILTAAEQSGFFKTTAGKVVLAIIVIAGCVGAFLYYRKKFSSGQPAPPEQDFFEKNDNGGEDGGEDGEKNFELPFYSGLYTGIYDQKGTRMPVQPFEIYFQEQFLETDNADDDDYSPTMFHTITGKGADMVGPYTLSGKSVGNKCSIIKKYYGQGNQVTDIGHEVTLRLDKLGDTHIFEGVYFVNTDEVQCSALYQMWPVGYNQQAPPPQQQQPLQPMYESSPSLPPPAAKEDVDDEENQNFDPPGAVAVAVAAVAGGEEDNNNIPVAVATATAVSSSSKKKKKKKKKKQQQEEEDY